MKKLFLILPLILLKFCGEDNSSDKVLSPLTPASVINVYPASYDFGTVKAGETRKTTSFAVNTDGFVTSRCNVESDILGLNIDDAKNTLETMYQNQTTSGQFSLSFTPMCKGNISGELFIVTDTFDGADVRIPINAVVTDDANILPKCKE